MDSDKRQDKKLLDLLKSLLPKDRYRQIEKAYQKAPALFDFSGAIERIRQAGGQPFADAAAEALCMRQLKEYMDSRKPKHPAIGVVLFDSLLMPLPQGVRPATVDTRRLKYQLPEGVLEMSLYPVTTEYYEMIGQLRKISPETVPQVTLHYGQKKIRTEANDVNLFHFPRIPAGACRLEIKSGKTTLARISLEI